MHRNTVQAVGYPASLIRRASIRAEAILRGRQARPYLAEVARVLHTRGWTTTDAPPVVQQPEADECFAALVLDSPTGPAAAPVWSEWHGWRTSPSRRHPLGRGAAWPSPGPNVRHLATGTTPDPADLVKALEAHRLTFPTVRALTGRL